MSEYYPREIYLKKIRPFVKETEIIKVLTGMRRCGKSSILHLVADELRTSGVADTQLLFLDLNAKENSSISTPKKLMKAIDRKFKGIDGLKFLFLDEVQNVRGFEKVVEAYRDDGHYSVFITGSNAHLLSGELTTKLTGRYIEFRIGTLSFAEYLGIKKFFGVPLSSNLDEEFLRYVREGGLPYAAKLQDPQAKFRYIQSVVEEIHEKDIAKNKKIRNRALFEQVEKYVLNNFGSTTSINALCDHLKNANGNRPSPHTIHNYLEILKDAKLIEECDRFDVKSKKSLQGEKKYYLTDLGIYFATNVDGRINWGPVLENVVYNYALTQDYLVSVGKIGKLEVDFILSKPFGAGYAYLQVCRTLNLGEDQEERKLTTEDREYRPLESIDDNYPKLILSLDHLPYSRSGIKTVNLIEKIAKEENFGF